MTVVPQPCPLPDFDLSTEGIRDFFTDGTASFAQDIAVASQLPGRTDGPADAYRHLVISAELHRRFEPGIADVFLELHEVGGGSNGPMDRHNNSVGELIGRYVASINGSTEDVLALVNKVMNASLPSSYDGDWVAHDDLFQALDATSITLPDGTVVGPILLAETNPAAWQGSNPRNEDGNRMPSSDANWPTGDTLNPWTDNFNYDGVEGAADYISDDRGAGWLGSDDLALVGLSALALLVLPASVAGAMIATAFGRYHYGGCVNGDLSLLAAFLAKIVTPLVIDMDGDGVELVSLADSTAFFDLNIDGYAELTGWVNPDDALLALDVDGDGIIDDNSELFGNQTGFANGFLALAAHDANADGVIDANDAVYADLIVWQDLDGDGFSDAGEMMGLADAGIVSISLNSTSTDFTNQGHWVSDVSTVTWGDGTNTSIEDVHFENDTRASVALLPDDFQYHVDAFKLPVLFGYGQIASTWVVLSQDATLRADAEALLDLLAVGNVSGFMTAFEDYLLAWADVDHIDPDSRNTNINPGEIGMDARHLTFLEKAYGTGFLQTWGFNIFASDPYHLAAAALTEQFDDLVERLAIRFVAQSAASDALLTSTTQAEFNTLFDAHLFSEMSNLVAGYSPSSRSLEGDLGPFFDSLVASIQSGSLAREDATHLLYMMRHDLEPNTTIYADKLRGLADANGTAEAYILSEGIRATFEGLETAFGTAGDDVLSVSDQGVLIGGEGNDTLSGSALADTYFYTSSDGSDVITDYSIISNLNPDRLVLTDANIADVLFDQSLGQDLVISFANNETVTVIDHFKWSYNAIELIEFADGTVLDAQDIRDKSVADQKASGFVTGTASAENYVHGPDDGSYTIFDYAISGTVIDRLALTDVTMSEVSFVQNWGQDLVVTLGNGETITVTDHFRSNDYDLEQISFADGTVLGLQEIRNKSVADQKASGTVIGSREAEHYYHALGDGSYTITDYGLPTNAIDWLVLSDVNAGDVVFGQNWGQDLVITFGNGETITIVDHFRSNDYDLEQISFADGTVLGLQEIRNKSVADQKASGTVIGSREAEHYYHALGDGSYTITDYGLPTNAIDWLVLSDVNAGDVVFGQNWGQDLVITFGNGETITIVNHFRSND
ncbi:calcium-binding protein, partial [Roseobacter sp. HKCCD9020]|uniref:calcium-binding protein n=1 Tax=Roseobacter sp. HKCCD9020 TaxID=2690685 RepID=UPI001492A23D|nr:hypothetical protein [Roseobacter sp. HKCCD9020]